MSKVLFELEAVPSMNGIGVEGFKVTVKDNGEVFALKYNKESDSNVYSIEGKYIMTARGTDFYLFLREVRCIAQDRTLQQQALTKEENDNIIQWVKFKFFDKVIEYPHTNSDVMDKRVVDAFLMLDKVVNLKSLLKIS